MDKERDIVGFVGTFTHQLDEKKRLSIPSDFRRLLQGELDGKINVYMRKVEGAVQIFAPEGVARMTARYSSESPEDPGFREKMLSIASAFQRKALDGQGRVMIPDEFISHANLKKNIVVMGAFGWFEIWSKETWKKMQKQKTDKNRYPGG